MRGPNLSEGMGGSASTKPLPLPNELLSMKLVSARKKNASVGDFIALLAMCVVSHACGPPAQETQVGRGDEARQTPAPAQAAGSETPKPARAHNSPNETAPVELIFARQGLSLSVNADAAFSLTDQAGTWSYAKNSSADGLWVYHGAARRTVTVEECEMSARSSLSVLRHGEPSVDEQAWSVAPDYAGTMRVVLLPQGGGLVEAFAVTVNRCLAVVYLAAPSAGFAQRLSIASFELLPSLKLLPRGQPSAKIGDF